ncbi:MAG: glycosyltransferase [Gracilibacteraceae bacterium]|jgi:glycosyltransferase involved in cell wall biosynthesis|nr:glycosyltransferase [Gracilibacteraceae bacterium]
MRVLHVVNSLDRGGVENMMMNVYRRVNRSQLQFDFLVQTDQVGVYEEEIDLLGGRVYRVPYQTTSKFTLPGQAYYAKLRGFFHALPLFTYPVIHSHLDRMSGLVLAAADDAGIPIRIAHSHAKRTTGATLTRLYKYSWGWFIRRYATHYAACSKEGARWLFGWPPRKVQVIPDAVNVRDFLFRDDYRQYLRKRHGWDNAYVIGYVGRLEAIKNPQFLLRVFSRLHARRPDALLVFFGCGSEIGALQALAAELHLLPYVQFWGERDDISQLLNALDILAVPSLAEGLGTAVVEAQANGLPCLASTGVPRSADMGAGLVQFLPLAEEVWQDHLCRPPGRKPTAWRPVVARGYDAFDVVDKITDFYLKAVKYGL